MKRIMIVGGSGSGKSTLARQLGEKLDLPVFHMDREVHWLPGWVERSKAEKLPLVAEIVSRETWVFEGGHSASYQMRLERAEFLVWTDAPFLVRIWRVIRRSFVDLGQTRPDMADGCPESPSQLPAFLKYLLTHRRKIDRRLEDLFDGAKIPKCRLRSWREINDFLNSL